MEEIRQRLRLFIQDNFLFGRSDGVLSDSESLVDGGIIDSTGVLLLVAFLEENFRLKVLDEEIVPDNLDSIDRLVRYVDHKVGADPMHALRPAPAELPYTLEARVG